MNKHSLRKLKYFGVLIFKNSTWAQFISLPALRDRVSRWAHSSYFVFPNWLLDKSRCGSVGNLLGASLESRES